MHPMMSQIMQSHTSSGSKGLPAPQAPIKSNLKRHNL